MKKHYALLILLVLVYSYLFYLQSTGINFLIFSVLLILLQLFLRPGLIREKAWKWVACTSIITGVTLVWQHTHLAFIANLLSLIVVTGFSIQPKASFFVVALHSLYSLAGSVLMSVLTWLKPSEQVQSKTPGYGFRLSHSFKVVVPPTLTAVFFVLYRNANPAFESLTDQLLTGWMSFDWLIFTFCGFWLLFGVFHSLTISSLQTIDDQQPDELVRVRKTKKEATFRLNGLRSEYQIGWLSFAMLNGLLLLVNGLDMYYLLIAKVLPDGMVYSSYVHQGVYTLIFSILLAIVIILYFFRGNLNFYQHNQKLKLVTYTWIIQNAMLALTTAGKTMQYVEQYGITHKRIGVLMYLLLTCIGLVITFLKVSQVRSNWFLFRKTSWAFYTVLVIATFLNWDRLITHYNLNHWNKNVEVDAAYLVSLSDANITDLIRMRNNPVYELTQSEKESIDLKIEAFRERYQQAQWQSWNYDDYKTARLIKK
jgi:hypothetical protein